MLCMLLATGLLYQTRLLPPCVDELSLRYLYDNANYAVKKIHIIQCERLALSNTDDLLNAVCGGNANDGS